MALDDRPRPGKEPTITPEAKAWLVSLACDKAKDHGYPHELWTTRLLARHAREHGAAAGHGCLANLVQGTVCKILKFESLQGALIIAVSAIKSNYDGIGQGVGHKNGTYKIVKTN